MDMRMLIVILLLFLGIGVVLGAKPKVVVLTNSIDYELASGFFGFLDNKGIEIIRVTESNFDIFKEEKFIIILGGPDAYEGVGDMVQQVLLPDEQDYLRASGNRKMFTKTNVWTQGQRVSVIAGSDRNQTKFAHVEHRDQLSNEIQQDFQSQQAEIDPIPRDFSISGGYQELLELEGVTVQLKSKYGPVFTYPDVEGKSISLTKIQIRPEVPDREEYYDIVSGYVASNDFYTKMEIFIDNTLDEEFDVILYLQDSNGDYYVPYIESSLNIPNILVRPKDSLLTKKIKTVYFHPTTSGEKRDFTLTVVLYGKDKRTYEIKW